MRQILTLITLTVMAACAWGADWQTYQPTSFMSDFAGVLTANEQTALNELLGQLKTQYNVVVLGVSVPSLEGVKIGELAQYFYDTWDVGRSTGNQSALVLVSKSEGQLHVYSGLGLRGLLGSQWSDKLAGRLERLLVAKKLDSATVAVMTAVVQRIHARSEDLPKAAFTRTAAPKGQMSALTSGDGSGLPVAALAAAGMGGFLLISTLVKAKTAHKGVYEWGRDFERGRTGAFGNKKPRWNS